MASITAEYRAPRAPATLTVELFRILPKWKVAVADQFDQHGWSVIVGLSQIWLDRLIKYHRGTTPSIFSFPVDRFEFLCRSTRKYWCGPPSAMAENKRNGLTMRTWSMATGQNDGGSLQCGDDRAPCNTVYRSPSCFLLMTAVFGHPPIDRAPPLALLFFGMLNYWHGDNMTFRPWISCLFSLLSFSDWGRKKKRTQETTRLGVKDLNENESKAEKGKIPRWRELTPVMLLPLLSHWACRCLISWVVKTADVWPPPKISDRTAPAIRRPWSKSSSSKAAAAKASYKAHRLVASDQIRRSVTSRLLLLVLRASRGCRGSCSRC